MINGNQSENNWTLFLGYAEDAFKQGNLAVAETLLQLALDEARSFGDSDLRYIYTLEHLGEVYFNLGRHQESVDIYQACLQFQERIEATSPTLPPRLYCRLAGSLVALGQYARAEALYQTAQTLFDEVLGEKNKYKSFIAERLVDIQKLKSNLKSPQKLPQRRVGVVPAQAISNVQEQKPRATRLPNLGPDQTADVPVLTDPL